MRNSIRSRLTLAFIIVATVPLLLVGVVLALRSFTVQQDQASFLEDAVARRVSTQVEAFVRRLEGELRVVVKELPGQSAAQKEELLSYLPSYPAIFQTLILLDNQGQEIVHLSRLEVVSPASYKDWSQAGEFTKVKDTGKTYYGAVQVDGITGEPSMSIAVPTIDGRDGLVENVLVANIRFKEIWDLLGNITVNAGEKIYIVDAQDRVIVHRNPSVVLRDTLFHVPAEPGIYTGLDNDSVVLAFNRIQFGDQVFVVVAEQAVTEALALAIQTVVVTVVLLIVALAIASLLGFYAARQLVRPIQTVAAAAHAISIKSEAFDPATLSEVVERTDELGQLARVFEDMGAQVQTREQMLKQQVQELRIEIDESKKRASVAEIVESDYFRSLEERASDIRKRRHMKSAGKKSETVTEPEQPASDAGSST